jgi:hypothetical protein
VRWHSIIISETRKKRWTEKSPIVKSLQKIVKINDRPLKPLAAVFFHFLTLGFNPESHIVSLLRCPVDTLMSSITTYLSIFFFCCPLYNFPLETGLVSEGDEFWTRWSSKALKAFNLFDPFKYGHRWRSISLVSFIFSFLYFHSLLMVKETRQLKPWF